MNTTRILGAIFAGLLILQGGLATLSMADETRAFVTVAVSVGVGVVGYLVKGGPAAA